MKRNVLRDGNESSIVLIEGLGPYLPAGEVQKHQQRIRSLELKLAVINCAIDDYYSDLDQRKHGGVAANKALRVIQEQLGRTWEQGKSLEADRPRCSLCGAYREDSELNGSNPLAPAGQKYADAYCRNLAECNSDQAEAVIGKVVKAVEQAQEKQQ